jgi:hypothetical protein
VLGKHRLEPKEKTELKVTYTTEGSPGIFQKKVTFYTDIPGFEKIDIFRIKGEVLEAPGAKISVKPRRIVIEGMEPGALKTESIAVTNGGSLPLVIESIRSEDGKTVYFDGAKEGNLVIDPAQQVTVELQLAAGKGSEGGRELIIIDSNAKNAGKSGYFLILQYK